MLLKKIGFFIAFFFVFPVFATQIITPVIVRKKTFYVSETGGSNIFFNKEDIKKSGAISLVSVLQNLAALQLIDTSGNQVSVSLRGFGSNASSNSLIIINGVPLTYADMAPPNLNSFLLDNIHSLIIHEGSEGVLYGNQAVGGVIEIETDLNKKIANKMICKGGSYLLKSCQFNFGLALPNKIFNLSLNQLSTANFREHNHDERQSVGGQIISKDNATPIFLDYFFAQEYVQYPGALSHELARFSPSVASNFTDYFSDSLWRIHLRLKNIIKNSYLNSDINIESMVGHGVLAQSFTQQRREYNWQEKLLWDLKKIHTHSGFNINVASYELNTLYFYTKNRAEQYSIFGFFNYALTHQWHFLGGLRFAAQLAKMSACTRIHEAFVMTMGVNYQLSTVWQFFLRRSGNYRFPKVDELSQSVMPLKTQTGVSDEAGVIWQYLKNQIHFNVYQLKLHREIAYDPMQTESAPFGTNTNLPPTKRQGASLQLQVALNTNISLESSLNVVKAQFNQGYYRGFRIPLVSQAIFHSGLSLLLNEKITLYVEARYLGNQYPANDYANMAGLLGGYTLYNLHAVYHHQKATLSFHINNLMNKRYYLYTVARTMIGEAFYPGNGREIIAEMSYDFD